MTSRAGIALALALLAWGGLASASEEPVVQTAAGSVRGMDEQGVQVFRGIPYAAPPVGALRWKPPAPALKWEGIRNASVFAPDCPGAFPDKNRMAEDCLYLNVWTGGTDPAAKRPVMVWIYGGGFRGGSAAAPVFDGAELARRGVVLVSFGYRTGSLGFLALPELSAESENLSSGNYGVLDAIAVLHWVQDNIAAFGGDPDNVTVFGQSSGSETVNILTASPLAGGLFQRVIGQSGSSFGVRAARDLLAAENAGKAFVARLGGPTLGRMRAMPWQDLLELDTEKLEPNIDGWVLPSDVHAAYLAGRQNDVPMLLGNTSQEFPRPSELAREAFDIELAKQYGPFAGAVAAQLGDGDPTDARWRLTNVEWGDFPAATWARLQTFTGNAPVYRYLFDYAPPPAEGQPRIARHGSELAYVFGTYRQLPHATPIDDSVGSLVRNYWVNFARKGDPNAADLPEWRPQSMAPDSYLRVTSQGANEEPARAAPLIDVLGAFHGTAVDTPREQ